MKKLSLVSNIIFIFLLISSCKNAPQQKAANTTESELVTQDSAIVVDTTKSNVQITSVDSIGVNPALRDSSKRSVTGKAIIHNAPDQAKIDSIKAEKLKQKK